MDFLLKIINSPVSPAHLAVLFALVIALGVRLGKIKFGGISLGVTFILFVGIVLGHFYNTLVVAPHAADEGFKQAMANQTLIINFVKELGLILFVYCIGIQVGPSFFATFKKGGVGMNMLAVALIGLNILMMLGLYFLVFYEGDGASNKENLAMMTGVLCGAVTNTPALGAANNVLPSVFSGVTDFSIGNGYACAYPLGVVGMIGTTILIKYICKVKLEDEAKDFELTQETDPGQQPVTFVLRITNKAVFGRKLYELSNFLKGEFICSRAKVGDKIIIPTRDFELSENAELVIVCAQTDKPAIAALIGDVIEEDKEMKASKSSNYVSSVLIVTKTAIEGKTLGELQISSLYKVNVTRVMRAGLAMFASRDLRLQMGDSIRVVGAEENVKRLENVVGNAQKGLTTPNIGMIFLGIFMGIILGQIPISIPGVEVPVKLGLAGGPLVMAIFIGAFGYKFKISSYISVSANLMLREVGLALFLAGVGIQAGASFWHTVTNGGLTYVWTGFLITTIPILICGLYGRLKMKLNYFTLMGLIAGSNTDPPALAFANQTAGNDAPAVGYSTVYPLTMFLRILVAQLVLLIMIPMV